LPEIYFEKITIHNGMLFIDIRYIKTIGELANFRDRYPVRILAGLDGGWRRRKGDMSDEEMEKENTWKPTTVTSR
jgi:hypothetical protein